MTTVCKSCFQIRERILPILPSACSAFAQTWFGNCSICFLCASARHRRCCPRWRTAAPRCSSSFIWPSSARGRVDPPCGTHRCATIPSFSTGGPSPSSGPPRKFETPCLAVPSAPRRPASCERGESLSSCLLGGCVSSSAEKRRPLASDPTSPGGCH